MTTNRMGNGRKQMRGDSYGQGGQQDCGGHSQGELDERGGKHGYDMNNKNTRNSIQQYGRRMEVSQQCRRTPAIKPDLNLGLGTVYDGDWGSILKFKNIPTSVSLKKLRSSLQQREVGGFYIRRSGVGEVNVKFRADMQVVIDRLKGLKIDDYIVEKVVIDHKSDPVSPELTDNSKNQVRKVLSKVPTEDLAKNVEHNNPDGNQEACSKSRKPFDREHLVSVRPRLKLPGRGGNSEGRRSGRVVFRSFDDDLSSQSSSVTNQLQP